MGHEGAVNEIAVFPDGRRLASAGSDGTLRIWDCQARTLLRSVKLGDKELFSVAVSPDGRYVAAGSNVVSLFDLEGNSKPRRIFVSEHNFESLAFSLDSSRLAAGARYHDIYLLDLSGKIIAKRASDARVESLEFLPDGSLLVPVRIATPNGKANELVQIWDADLKDTLREFDIKASLTGARASPNGNVIVAAGRASLATLFDLATGEMLAATPPSRGSLNDSDFAPNSQHFALGYGNGAVEIYQFRKGALSGRARTCVRSFRAHVGGVFSLKYLDNSSLATCGADGRIKIWDVAKGALTSCGVGLEMVDVHISPDEAHVAYTHVLGCRLLSADNGKSIANHTGSTEPTSTSAWSPSGELAVAMGPKSSHAIRILDSQGEHVDSFEHPGPVNAVAFSPDGRWFASLGSQTLTLHQADSGRVVHKRPLPSTGRSLAFAHDCQRLVYGTQAHATVVISLAPFAPLFEIGKGHGSGCLALTQDDRCLATGHGDGVIRLWDFATGSLQCELVGHAGPIRDVAFSADGLTLLSASDDGTVRVWSVKQQREYGILYRARMENTDAPVVARCHLSLSSGDRYLVIGDSNAAFRHNLHIWDLGAYPMAKGGK